MVKIINISPAKLASGRQSLTPKKWLRRFSLPSLLSDIYHHPIWIGWHRKAPVCTNIETFYWEMELEKLPNVVLPPVPPRGMDMHGQIWHCCSLGKPHWPAARTDGLNSRGLKLPLESLQSKVLEGSYNIGLSCIELCWTNHTERIT